MEVTVYDNQSAFVFNQSVDWNALVTRLVEIDPHAAEVFVKIGATISLASFGYVVAKNPWGAIVGGVIGLGVASLAYR